MTHAGNLVRAQARAHTTKTSGRAQREKRRRGRWYFTSIVARDRRPAGAPRYSRLTVRPTCSPFGLCWSELADGESAPSPSASRKIASTSAPGPAVPDSPGRALRLPRRAPPSTVCSWTGDRPPETHIRDAFCPSAAGVRYLQYIARGDVRTAYARSLKKLHRHGGHANAHMQQRNHSNKPKHQRTPQHSRTCTHTHTNARRKARTAQPRAARLQPQHAPAQTSTCALAQGAPVLSSSGSYSHGVL